MSETFVPALINLALALGAMMLAGAGLFAITYSYYTTMDWREARRNGWTLNEYYSRFSRNQIKETSRERR